MKKAFTLVEVVIVVAILGIVAAIAVPQFQNHTQQARESAAKDNLRILRQAIERYAIEHNGVPPGYPNNDTSRSPNYLALRMQMINSGNYLSQMPENPFNNIDEIRLLDNGEIFPESPEQTDTHGWIYQPSTKTIRLNWEGTDSQTGQSYFDY